MFLVNNGMPWGGGEYMGRLGDDARQMKSVVST